MPEVRRETPASALVPESESLDSPAGAAMNYERVMGWLTNDREAGTRPKPAGLEMQVTLSLTEIHQSTGVEPESAPDVEVELRNLFEALKVSPQPIYVGCLAFEVKAVLHSAHGIVLHGRAVPRVENQ